jgi:hypothetical protein
MLTVGRRFSAALSTGSIVLALVTAGQAMAQDRDFNRGNDQGRGQDGSVTVFADTDFLGTSESFDGDVPDLGRTRVGNDQLSSVRVPEGCEVTLYSDTDYSGRELRLTRDEASLGRTSVGNDSVSSLRVTCSGSSRIGNSRGSVALFSDTDFRGATESFRGDVPVLGQTRVGNDQASSIRIPRGCEVTIYADTDYGGNSVRLDSDESDLGRTSIGNDQASSMHVNCGGSDGSQSGVTLYTDNDYGGTSQSFSNDVPELGRTRIGNDQVSSIRVPSGCEVTLYADTGYGGEAFVTNRDEAALGRTTLGNDQASSMRVDCR